MYKILLDKTTVVKYELNQIKNIKRTCNSNK